MSILKPLNGEIMSNLPSLKLMESLLKKIAIYWVILAEFYQTLGILILDV